MTGDPFNLPPQFRETALKLEVQQFARGEMHLVKEDESGPQSQDHFPPAISYA